MLVSGTVAQFMIVEHTRNRCSPIVNYGCSAFSVVKGMNADPTWERIGATVHLVGSLKSGLLAKSRDIDLHIYTDTLDIAASFSVMQELAEQLSLKEIQFKNLIQTEEECIEWHVIYEDEDRNTWKFDMIHKSNCCHYELTYS